MATVVRGYKTELDLNNEQRTACMKHAGASRFAYNWGLARSKEAYRTTGKRSTVMQLHRELNVLKQTDYPWMYETSKCAPQEALRDLETAYKNFFRRVELKKQGKWKGKLGFPRPKKRSKERTFVCEDCGMVLDRDLNAAINVRMVAVSSIDTQNAYGERSTGSVNGRCETALVEVGTNQLCGLSIKV
jgi:transposase